MILKLLHSSSTENKTKTSIIASIKYCWCYLLGLFVNTVVSLLPFSIGFFHFFFTGFRLGFEASEIMQLINWNPQNYLQVMYFFNERISLFALLILILVVAISKFKFLIFCLLLKSSFFCKISNSSTKLFSMQHNPVCIRKVVWFSKLFLVSSLNPLNSKSKCFSIFSCNLTRNNKKI